MAIGFFWLGACTYKLPPLSPQVEELPQTLSRTGLYADAALSVLASDVHEYRPSYSLWSDGASKRRFIQLPAGSQIDTTDPDDWSFPLGTKLWKEFSVGGRRIETRLLQRVRDTQDGWAAAAYVWDADQRSARITVDGVDDALETAHDVPQARACPGCHAGRNSFVLGFSAVQLTHPATSESELTLDRLIGENLLSSAPTDHTQVPGDDVTRDALGYLHANCGNCHNHTVSESARYVRPRAKLDLWLTASSLSKPETTPTYRTTLQDYIVPGQPDQSQLWVRMQGRTFFGMRRRMPPIATERVDTEGSALIARWIRSLPAAAQR